MFTGSEVNEQEGKKEGETGSILSSEVMLTEGRKMGGKRRTAAGRSAEFKRGVKYSKKEGQEEGKSERTKDYQDRRQPERRETGPRPFVFL